MRPIYSSRKFPLKQLSYVFLFLMNKHLFEKWLGAEDSTDRNV